MGMNFEQLQQLEELKKVTKSTMRKDAESFAWRRSLRHLNKDKFKVSHKQYRTDMELAWLAGEMSSAERILRCIDLDEELNNRELIQGELHMYIMDVKAELEKHMGPINVGVEDLMEGLFSTEYHKERLFKNHISQQTEEVTDAVQ